MQHGEAAIGLADEPVSPGGADKLRPLYQPRDVTVVSPCAV